MLLNCISICLCVCVPAELTKIIVFLLLREWFFCVYLNQIGIHNQVAQLEGKVWLHWIHAARNTSLILKKASITQSDAPFHGNL